MMKCEHCKITNCLLVDNCDQKSLQLIDDHKIELKFKEGNEFISAGDIVDGIYFIESGLVKISLNRFEEDRVIRLAKEGDILGHRGFGGDLIYPISVTALSDIRLTFIPKDIFTQVIKSNPEFSYQLMMFFAEELKNTERRMQELLRMTVIERISTAIMFNLRSFGMDENNILNFTLNRRDMASLVGASYETIVRMLKKLEKQGIIKNIGKKIQIINLEEIRKYCLHDI